MKWCFKPQQASVSTWKAMRGESLCLHNKHCVVWKQRIEIWIRDGTLWKLRSLAYCWRPCPCPRNIWWFHMISSCDWRQRRGLWDWRQSDEVNLKLWSTVKKVTSAHLGVASRCHQMSLERAEKRSFDKRSEIMSILYHTNVTLLQLQDKKKQYRCPLNQFKGQRPKHSEQCLEYTRSGLGASSSLDCCMAMRPSECHNVWSHVFCFVDVHQKLVEQPTRQARVEMGGVGHWQRPLFKCLGDHSCILMCHVC
jgi:hypothetical protein